MNTAVDWSLLATWVPTVALAVGLSATAGLRAWLPLLATGLLARFDVVTVGEHFAFLSSTPALVLFGIATILEVTADKVPVLDHALDVISSVLRPVAGTLLSAAVMWQVNDPLIALGLGLVVGAPTAAMPHAAKSVARVASTSLTAGLASPIVSAVEDALAVFMLVLAVLVPIVLAVVVAVVAIVVLRRLRRRPSSSSSWS
jgi:hypothetical protein